MAVKICGCQSGRKRFLAGKMAVKRPFFKLSIINKHSGKGWVQLQCYLGEGDFFINQFIVERLKKAGKMYIYDTMWPWKVPNWP
jgi:hypothetical protein